MAAGNRKSSGQSSKHKSAHQQQQRQQQQQHHVQHRQQTHETQQVQDKDAKLTVWTYVGRSQPEVNAATNKQPHPRLPELPTAQGALFFECTLFLYSVACLFMLGVNVYRTVWWIPNSHVHTSIKMHLIDPYLLSCIGLLLGRRVTLCFFDRVVIIPPEHRQNAPGILHVVQFVLKMPMFVAVASSFMFSFLRVMQTYTRWQIAMFGLPFVFYLAQFYDEIFGRAHQLLDAERIKHACTSSPHHIRSEVEILYKDLAYRIRLLIHASVCTTYLCIVLPLVFVPSNVQLQYVWLAQFTLIVFGTSATLYATYLFPLQYSELLHRATLHAGTWRKEVATSGVTKDASDSAPAPSSGGRHSTSSTTEGINEWNENCLYRADGNVIYAGDTYRAIGIVGVGVASKPDNKASAQLHRLAYSPVRIPNILCAAQLFVIAFEFGTFLVSPHWNQTLTLSLCMFVNFLLFFKLFKDKTVISKCYGIDVKFLS